mgnify:CR=1 FL=1
MAAPVAANPDVPNYAQVVGHHAMAQEAIALLFSTLDSNDADIPLVEVERQRATVVRNQELRDMMALLVFLEVCFRLDYLEN